MGLLDSRGLQMLWAKVKAHVKKSLDSYIKDARLEDNQLTFTKGNGDKSFISLSEGSNSVPFVTFQCYSTEYTVADLFTHMLDVGFPSSVKLPSVVANGEPVIVNFVGMVSGTYLCRFSNYHDDYYGCDFTDLTNLKKYYFEGESSSTSLYDNLSNGGTSSGDSSIIDLGDIDTHKDAQQAMVDYVSELTDEMGCVLFKYYCTCGTEACFAIVSHSSLGVGGFSCVGIVYSNYRTVREFVYDSREGFTVDGCWEGIPIDYGNGSSGGATLSMPRIRLANWYYDEIPVYDDIEEDRINAGRIVFSVNIQDGTVQEGDQLQVCSMRKVFGKNKLRPILSRYITSEDIENLSKQPYLQISTDDMAGNVLSYEITDVLLSFLRTDSKKNAKPKFIRIRRPIYKDGDDVGATFSNVEPVYIRLKYVFLSEQLSEQSSEQSSESK